MSSDSIAICIYVHIGKVICKKIQACIRSIMFNRINDDALQIKHIGVHLIESRTSLIVTFPSRNKIPTKCAVIELPVRIPRSFYSKFQQPCIVADINWILWISYHFNLKRQMLKRILFNSCKEIIPSCHKSTWLNSVNCDTVIIHRIYCFLQNLRWRTVPVFQCRFCPPIKSTRITTYFSPPNEFNT